MFVTVFGNFQQVYLHIHLERSILFWELVPKKWDDDLVGGPNFPTQRLQKEKVFALIPNTPGAHSICVHCAAKDPGVWQRGMFRMFRRRFGVVWGRGVGVVVSWKICSKK